MQHAKSALVRSLLAAGLMTPLAALATNGYFSHGYGMKGKGMAGATVSQHQDAFGGANNPASMVWAGSRLDVGIDWFSPKRKASRTGSAPINPDGSTIDFSAESDSNNFYIPEFGYNRMLGTDMSLGITVYGNGGMNTDYPGDVANCTAFGVPSANGLCGAGRLGVDLMQLLIAPTFAWKFHPSHSVGIAPLFGYQRFQAEGLQQFDNPFFSAHPGSVTNRGYDSSTGWGARIGYMGKLGNAVTIGAQYTTKMRMEEFDKYKGLFAENGGFDIPEHYAVGATFHATPALQISLDYEQIKYSGIASISNPSSNPAQFGSSNGPGFGWQDVDVIKVGVQWKMSDQLTLRAGYNHGDNPIRSQDVTPNIIAPGVVQDHYTLGFTWNVSPTSEVTMAYMHAAKESVTGPSFFNNLGFGPIGGNETIEMYENSLGIAWGMKF